MADAVVNLRRNTEQVHEASRQIGAFLASIHERDASLRGGEGRAAPPGAAARRAAAPSSDEDSEEEREIAEAKDELRRLGEQQARGPAAAAAAPRPAAAAKAMYARWERFDAEGAVRELEELEAGAERLRREVARLENRRAQARVRRQQRADARAADELRRRGNATFEAARYEEAVALYTEALRRAPRAAALYANRALALLKLRAHAEVEEDCSAALALDPAHVKARLRRAQARQALGAYDGALEDLEAALEAEPRNGAARRRMQECRQLRARAAAGAAAAAAAPPRRPPRRALAVDEVGHDADNDGDEFVLSVTAPPPGTGAPPPPAAAAPPPGAGAPPAAGTNAEAAAGAVRRLRDAWPGASAAALGEPRTAADVERAWRSLRREPEQWAQYVARLEPALLARLFRSSLPPELLAAFLAALDGGHFFPQRAPAALAALRALSTAGRLSILTMCLDRADAAAIDSVFRKLDRALEDGRLAAADTSARELRELRAKFE